MVGRERAIHDRHVLLAKIHARFFFHHFAIQIARREIKNLVRSVDFGIGQNVFVHTRHRYDRGGIVGDILLTQIFPVQRHQHNVCRTANAYRIHRHTHFARRPAAPRLVTAAQILILRAVIAEQERNFFCSVTAARLPRLRVNTLRVVVIIDLHRVFHKLTAGDFLREVCAGHQTAVLVRSRIVDQHVTRHKFVVIRQPVLPRRPCTKKSNLRIVVHIFNTDGNVIFGIVHVRERDVERSHIRFADFVGLHNPLYQRCVLRSVRNGIVEGIVRKINDLIVNDLRIVRQREHLPRDRVVRRQLLIGYGVAAPFREHIRIQLHYRERLFRCAAAPLMFHRINAQFVQHEFFAFLHSARGIEQGYVCNLFFTVEEELRRRDFQTVVQRFDLFDLRQLHAHHAVTHRDKIALADAFAKGGNSVNDLVFAHLVKQILKAAADVFVVLHRLAVLFHRHRRPFRTAAVGNFTRHRSRRNIYVGITPYRQTIRPPFVIGKLRVDFVRRQSLD